MGIVSDLIDFVGTVILGILFLPLSLDNRAPRQAG